MTIQEEIAADIDWRNGELAELRVILHKAKLTETQRKTYIRYIVPAIYALWEGFVKMLACYAPHLGEELWQKLGHDKTCAYETWPTFDEKYTVEDTKEYPVMINGKLRAKFEAAANADNATLEALAKETDGFKKFTEGKEIAKIIVVPGKLVNIVVK